MSSDQPSSGHDARIDQRLPADVVRALAAGSEILTADLGLRVRRHRRVVVGHGRFAVAAAAA